MAIPNLINVTSVFGKTTSTVVGTATTVLVSNPAGSNRSYKINSIYISNIDNSATTRVSLDFFRNLISIRLVDRISIQPGNTLIAMSRDTSIYLEEGDSIRCYAEINDKTHVTISYEINA